jgi:hypothetical protein
MPDALIRASRAIRNVAMTNVARPIDTRNAPSWHDYARWLASLGVHVFPLNPATKRPFANKDVATAIGWPEPPHGEGGLKFATTDVTAIGAWWARWPAALIGIRTGNISRLYVLDVDRKNDKDGFTTISANNWTIPDTVAAQTPSGGAHYYFCIPRNDQRRWKTDSGQMGSGLDRRGDDGYVVWYSANLSQPMSEPPVWMTADIRSQNELSPRENRKPLGTDQAPQFSDATKALHSTDPNEMNYDEWRNISCAFRQSASGLGVDDAMVRLAWDGWCARYQKNSSADNEKLWRSMANGTELGWSYLRSNASPGTQGELIFGVPNAPRTIVTPQQPRELDGYEQVISSVTGDNGKNTLIETVKLLHGNLPVVLDEFTQTVLAMSQLPWDKTSSYPRQWTETDTIHCQLYVQASFMRPGKETVHDAITIIANRHKRHQVRDYFNTLQWDGIERLPLLATRYFRTEDTPYTRFVCTKFMIGAVARIMKPGCKMDNVIILKGAQGKLKSSSIAALAGSDWFTDELPDLQTKDAAIQLAGKWIIEVSELSAFKRSDVETIKKFMSRSNDRYRAPYERTAADHLRQCVFVATTNDEQFLKDQTGNRRFWPLACGTIEVEAIKRDRDQLWAEALTRYRNGERWWLEDHETKLAELEQEEHREVDPWEDRIGSYVGALNGMPTTVEQICFVLSIPFEKQNSVVNGRIAKCLNNAKYFRRRIRNGDDRVWRYVKQG